MKKLLLDTNFLLIPYQYKIDVFSEIKHLMEEPYEICIFENTRTELKNIVDKQTGKEKDAALYALKMVISKEIKELASEEATVDDDIFALSKKEKIIVASQDRELKSKLKDKARLIVLRQKQYLKIV